MPEPARRRQNVGDGRVSPAPPNRSPGNRNTPSRSGTSRSYEQIAGADGMVSRLVDRIIENPAQSAGVLLVGVVMVAIVTNAAFFQRVHHPDPFFITRPDAADVPLPKPKAAMAAPAAPVAGSLVADTQRALAAAKLYDGQADGVLGPQTKASISGFEKKLGLAPTGQPSQRLLVQIKKGVPHPDLSEPASTASIDDPAMRSRVRRIQEALNRLGYGPVDANGQNGAKSATAVRRFQLDNGLPMTGIADSTVMAKLVMIGAVPAP